MKPLLIHVKQALIPPLHALQTHFRPLILVQLCSITLVYAYYHHTGLQKACTSLAHWKQQGGVLLAALSTVFAAVVLAEIAKALTGHIPRFDRAYRIHLLFISGLFAISGALVDRFYLLQSLIFGDNHNVLTVVTKVAVDQFIYSTFWAVPFSIIWFVWGEEQYDFKRTLKRLNLELYLTRGLPLTFSNWLYWIPMTSCIYSLPYPLQFPLFIFAMAAWSILFVFIARSFTVPAASPLSPN